MLSLLSKPLSVVNVGLAGFADAITTAGTPVVTVEWAPPAEGDRELGRALAELLNDPRVEEANAKALSAYLGSNPRLVGTALAKDVLPGFTGRTILHSGPPITFDRMCGPVQGAVIGAILFEGWAKTDEEARTLVASGAISFAPCHHFSACGPMAGIVCPSMPMWIVEDPANGTKTFCSFNEGLGKVLRFGAYGEEVLKRLAWMRDVMQPTVDAALRHTGPIDLKPLMAQALHMGDEVHNRNAAASGLLLKRLLPGLLADGLPQNAVRETIAFISDNDHTFLNVSMAACKAMLHAAHNIPGSTMVTVMARNGVDFGIRVSGAGDTWFVAPSPMVQGLFFPGYSEADAARDLGDSAITETAGVGGFAMASAPAIVKFVGGTPSDALAYSQEMGNITIGRNENFTLPMLNFIGTAAGIDCRKVVDTGIGPVTNTGIAHKEAGIGQIGAGVTRAPLECFAKALSAVAVALKKDPHHD